MNQCATMTLWTTVLCVTIVIIGCNSTEIGKQNSQLDPFTDHTANSSRISNGHEATDNQFPYHVSIHAGHIQAVRSGALINPSWVLTAGNVIGLNTIFHLRFGSKNRLEGGVEQVSYSTIVHPLHNIALISIPSPLIFGPTMSAIRLPAAAQDHEDFIHRKAIISGWGRSTPFGPVQVLLRWVHVRPIGNDECRANLGQSGSIPAEHICAIGYDDPDTQGPCEGDTGGPLVINENGIPTLIGINLTERDEGCVILNAGVYLRTVNFLEWINTHTGIAIRSN